MSGRRYKVMLVDDDESVRESLRKLLEAEGYRVIQAANGAEAMETFRHNQCQVDLMLVDLNLPVKNGWVTVNQVHELNPGLPVFVITALSHQKELAEAAGVSALVEKPFDVAQLLLLMRQRLAQPVRSALAHPHQPEFPFCHVLALHHAPRNFSRLDDISPYARWGLNE